LNKLWFHLDGWELDIDKKVEAIKEALLVSPDIFFSIYTNESNRVKNEIDRIVPIWFMDRVNIFQDTTKNTPLKSMFSLLKEGEISMWLSADDTALIWKNALTLWRVSAGVIPSLCVQSFNTFNSRGEMMFLDAGFDVWKNKSSEQKAKKMIEDVVMISTYLQKVRWIEKPRVWLLNNGIENYKWDDLRLKVYSLLEELDYIEFIWNIEWNKATHNECDVLLADWFLGNIALKLVEGQNQQLGWEVSRMIKENWLKWLVAGFLLRKELNSIKDSRDPNNFPLGLMLGLKSLVWKIHWSAEKEWYKNSFLQANRYIEAEKEYWILSTIWDRIKLFREFHEKNKGA